MLRFDVIVLDLFWGECGIGLAGALGKPIVGYWGMTPSGMWMDYTGTVKKMGPRLRELASTARSMVARWL